MAPRGGRDGTARQRPETPHWQKTDKGLRRCQTRKVGMVVRFGSLIAPGMKLLSRTQLRAGRYGGDGRWRWVQQQPGREVQRRRGGDVIRVPDRAAGNGT
jgi:hypothetical protein